MVCRRHYRLTESESAAQEHKKRVYWECFKMKSSQVIGSDKTSRIIKWLLMALIALIVPVALGAAETGNGSVGKPVYSLNRLYRLGLMQSEQIKMAKNQLYIAERDEDRAFSVLVPTFSAYGDYIRYSEANAVQPETGYEYGIKLQQQFTVNGRELILLKAAKDVITQRKYDLDAVSESFLYNIASAFYDIVNKKKRLEILSENVNRLTLHKQAVEKKLVLEEVPKTQLLRTEAELSGAVSERVRAENDLIFARSSLARLINISTDYEIQAPPAPDAGAPFGDLETYTALALKNRSDIKSARMDILLAKEDVDLTKSEYWPVLSLEAGYKVQETDPDALSGDPSLYAAANLNVVLFDWGLRSGTLGQNKATLRNAELQLTVKTKEVTSEVERAWLTIITAKNSIVALKDKLDFSRANYDAVSLQFNLGQADSLDVLDANTILSNAERELSEAEFYLDLSKIGLERAQGIFLNNIRANLDSGDPAPSDGNTVQGLSGEEKK